MKDENKEALWKFAEKWAVPCLLLLIACGAVWHFVLQPARYSRNRQDDPVEQVKQEVPAFRTEDTDDEDTVRHEINRLLDEQRRRRRSTE